MSFRNIIEHELEGQGSQVYHSHLCSPLASHFSCLAEEGSTKFHRVVFSDKKNLVFFEVGRFAASDEG